MRGRDLVAWQPRRLCYLEQPLAAACILKMLDACVLDAYSYQEEQESQSADSLTYLKAALVLTVMKLF